MNRIALAWLLTAACAISLISASTRLAYAQTRAEILARNCPAAYHEDKMQQRAHDLAENEQYPLAKKAASLYYDCAQNLSDPYAHDLARLIYLELLSVSVPASDSSRLTDVLILVKYKANELAATTRFSDIRSIALNLRDSVASELGNSPH